MTSPRLSFVGQSIDSICQAAKQRLRRSTKPYNHDSVLNAAMDLTRNKSELLLENMLLRQQLIVPKRQAKRPTMALREQTLFVLLASRLRTWKQAPVIVQPETALRWHSILYRWVWKRKSRLRRRSNDTNGPSPVHRQEWIPANRALAGLYSCGGYLLVAKGLSSHWAW